MSGSGQGSSARRGRRLDPDALAALEEERDFLLRSLDDLDEEHDAGEMSEEDYRALRDDYTARAADALRAIEDRRATMAAARPPRNPWRTAVIAAAVALVAGLAGWGVAQAAGDRTAGEQATGGIGLSVGQQLTTCLQRSQSTEAPVEVLECYDDILEEHPANVEALTYRGWFLVRAGLPDLAWDDLRDAVALDAEYPDVRVFRAIALHRMCRPDEALAELDVLDELDPSSDIDALVTGSDLRGAVVQMQAARDAVPEVAGAPTPIDEVELDERVRCEALAAAGVFEEPEEGTGAADGTGATDGTGSTDDAEAEPPRLRRTGPRLTQPAGSAPRPA